MAASGDRGSTAPTCEQVEHVVALLEVVYQANGRLAAADPFRGRGRAARDPLTHRSRKDTTC